MSESSSIKHVETDGFTKVKSNKASKFIERYQQSKQKLNDEYTEKFNIAKKKLQESILPEDWESHFDDSNELILLQWFNINKHDKDFDAEKHLIDGFFPSKLIFNSFDGTPTIQEYLTERFKDEEDYSFTIFTDKKHPKRIKYLKIMKKKAKMGFFATDNDTLEKSYFILKDIIMKDWEEKLNASLGNEEKPQTYTILYTFGRKYPTDEDYEESMINGVFIFDILFKQIPDSELPPLIEFLKNWFVDHYDLSFFTMKDKLSTRPTTNVCVGLPREFTNTKKSNSSTSYEEPEEHEDESFDIGSSVDFPAM